jgi:hypothetical protein
MIVCGPVDPMAEMTPETLMGTVIWAGETAGAPVEADGEPEHPTITVVRRSRDMRVFLDIGNLPFMFIRIAAF